MAFRRHKRGALPETDSSSASSQEQTSATGDSSAGSLSAKLAMYSLGGNDAPATGDGEEAPSEQRTEREPTLTEDVVTPDVATIGEEVGSVLKSAHEAAARIRRAAEEEAERVRAEVDAHAKDTRAAAETFAAERRSAATQEAAQLVEDAQKRRDATEAEIERKLAEMTAKQRHRLETLEAEVEHHEGRAKSLLDVFRGMTSQLEALLEAGRDESGERVKSTDAVVETSDEMLEDALRPGASS
jgi:hypothetical protein